MAIAQTGGHRHPFLRVGMRSVVAGGGVYWSRRRVFEVGCFCAWGAWVSCWMWTGLGAGERCGVCGSWRVRGLAQVARKRGAKTLLRERRVVVVCEGGGGGEIFVVDSWEVGDLIWRWSNSKCLGGARLSGKTNSFGGMQPDHPRGSKSGTAPKPSLTQPEIPTKPLRGCTKVVGPYVLVFLPHY